MSCVPSFAPRSPLPSWHALLPVLIVSSEQLIDFCDSLYSFGSDGKQNNRCKSLKFASIYGTDIPSVWGKNRLSAPA
jgi:hypothetical protein